MTAFILLLVVSSSLVLHVADGADFLDVAPALQENEASYYFMLFEEGKTTDNNMEFPIIKDNQISDSKRILKVICRENEGVMSLDVVTNGAKEEDQIVLDTVFVDSCNSYQDIFLSIFLLPSSSEQEFLIFVDPEGKCHRRTYTPKTWQFTAIVHRSKLETIDCPKVIQQLIKGHKAVVREWSPEGLALDTFFIDKPAIGSPSVPYAVDFPNAPGYKLVCRRGKIRYDDEEYKQNERTLFTATVEYEGVPLDRFKLKEPDESSCGKDKCSACNIDNITPETVSTEKGMHKITFQTPEGTQKREYKLFVEPKPGYKIVTLERRLSNEKIATS